MDEARRTGREATGRRRQAARLCAFALVLVASLPGPGRAQGLPSDAAILDGFSKVVFDAEITGTFSDSSYLKKFAGPVRFRVENKARIDRTSSVSAFLRQVDRQIAGLETSLAEPDETANFVVHVVDRAQYQRTGREIYRNPFMRVPGNCIVRASYGRSGITRSDALIVSDEGDALFRRCLIEEVLQGLGPLAENVDAPQSVFNDTSRITSFTSYDRVLMNMLYDARLEPGMSLETAKPLLPQILRDARRRVQRR